MNAANRNATRLATDAKLLLENGSFATAASLAALSIEESGKGGILRGLAMVKDAGHAQSEWLKYRSHTKKNQAWILPGLVSRGARLLDDLAPLFAEDAEHPQLLDQIKQIGLYTDCLGDAHWSEPDKVVSEELARNLVATASLLARQREISTEEIELWIEHFQAVAGRSVDWVNRGLVLWYRACVERGLIEGDETAMEKFIYGPGIPQ